MLPILNSTKQTNKKYVVAFRGINYGEGWQDGEFSDTKNLSSAQFPCLSQRFGRVFAGDKHPNKQVFYAKGAVYQLQFSSAGYVYLTRDSVIVYTQQPGGTLFNAEPKQITSIGNYLIFFPDKAYYNTATNEVGSLEETYTATGLTFEGGKIITTGDAWRFRKGDAVTITGCTSHPENNKTIIVRGVSGSELSFYDNSFTAGVEAGAVMVKREVPDLDYVCESNYRLWGVKGNTIYGSKYGDPFNFNCFDGVSGDSYYIDVGTDGEFTGCIPFASHICFFKENCLHKLYGSKPSNYQVVTSQVYGLQKGSDKSMCIINETLYYKGVLGVYAYTGGVPELVSECFGQRRYHDACAATDGTRYYISMADEDGNWHLMNLDVEKGIWVREDDFHAIGMGTVGGKVHMVSKEWSGYIDEGADISDVEWSATLCPFTEVMNERKGYSKFHLRLDLAAGAWLKVEIKRNTDKRWQTVYATHNERAQTVTVPILPARCDSVEIRLSGKGECKIRTFVREFHVGSDI